MPPKRTAITSDIMDTGISGGIVTGAATGDTIVPAIVAGGITGGFVTSVRRGTGIGMTNGGTPSGITCPMSPGSAPSSATPAWRVAAPGSPRGTAVDIPPAVERSRRRIGPFPSGRACW